MGFPAPFDDGSKNFTNTRCKGDWTKVFGIGWVGNSFRFGNEFDHSSFPLCRDLTCHEAGIVGREEETDNALGWCMGWHKWAGRRSTATFLQSGNQFVICDGAVVKWRIWWWNVMHPLGLVEISSRC